jgi:uncharacterized membrane protein (GlpM family)
MEVIVNAKLLALNFVIGGTIVTLTTYFGKRGDSTLAAMVALFPSISVVSLCMIYSGEGAVKAANFAKGLLILLPAWVIYALTLWQLLPRIGLVLSLLIGISLYLGIAFTVTRLVHY